GLYYVRARWYDPMLGRFVSYDPIQDVERNQFSYAGNNPVNMVDLLGLQASEYSYNFDVLETLANKEKKMNRGRFSWRYGKWIGSEIPLFNGNHNVRMQSNNIDLRWFVQGYTTGSKTLSAYNLVKLGGGYFYEALKAWFGSGSTVENWKTNFDSFFLCWYWRLAGMTLSDFAATFGMCPTFVQGGQVREEKVCGSDDTLMARIKAPWTNSLLRSDIPIYGISSGKAFSRYRVEYGKGSEPTEWYLMEKSNKPQAKSPDFKNISWMQGDLDLKGNLATWNTGLKNWVHLPWHPTEDPTDFNGIYTIRLIVEGKDGKSVEDRVTCEVGRVIAQCLPCIAVSPDKTVTMRFPEQSLTQPFRIYTILPFSNIGEDEPPLPKKGEFIGQVYRIREPGDQFIKDVSLEFAANIDELGKRKPKNVGIGCFDSARNEWNMLATVYDKESHVFKTTISKLHSPKAVYALIYNRKKTLSLPAPNSPKPPAPLKPVQAGVLVDNTLEKDMGTFKARDRIVGSTLSRDNKATPDGSYCLKFVNQNFGGNFSATILDRPFDVREYGTMAFDYRIGPQTKIDFLLKVNGRWYNLRFTGDSVDYCQRDVNIANMGAIEGIIPDDKWHTASVDLRYLLRQQTHHTHVDEIVMANWGVGGYMKLEFGNNPRGATYYIDNFKLAGPGRVQKKPPVLLVDDFNEVKSKNNLGRAFGTYSTPGSNCFKDSSIDVVPEAGGSAQKASDTRNRALLLTFDTTKPDSYGGYWTSIAGSDLSEYLTLAFRMRTDGDVPAVTVGIRNRHGVEGKTDLRQYASAPDA
ncbi:MAG: RHS repeat-associated core domain-containing protein, partial [Deltaproteobacteria bacterium]|nr:RHS repeat-associated core domain-containing protein [Deltaproteobacteria bacterium]